MVYVVNMRINHEGTAKTETYLFAFRIQVDTERGIFLLETVEGPREIGGLFADRR